MSCQDYSTLLEDLFDGALAERERARVEAHLEQCAECASVVEELRREQAIFAAYDRGFEPNADAMWSAIAERIAPAESPKAVALAPAARWRERWSEWLTIPRLAPIAIAACALVIGATVALNVWTVPQTSTEPGPERASVQPEPEVAPESGVDDVAPPAETASNGSESEVAVAPPPAEPRVRRVRAPRPTAQPSVPDLPISVATAEAQYLKAIALLERDVRAGDTPEGSDVKQLEKPLGDIDRNIQFARRAVKENPDDPLAVIGMFAAYDEKVDVLQQMARYQVARER